MSRNYRIHDGDQMYFVTFCVLQKIPVLDEDHYKEILVECFRFCEEQKGLKIYSWCIMPDHVHLVISSEKDKLWRILGDMKSYTSRMIRKKMLEHKSDERIKRYLTSFMLSGLKSRKNIDWQFWEQHNHAVVIEDDEQFFNVLNYIHHNPVKAGICSSPEMYKYSSARNFSEENGLIE